MLDQARRNRWVLGALAACGLALGLVKVQQPATTVEAFTDKKAAGAELFATRGCAHCHGDDGQGTDRAPALHDLRKRMNADRIRDQIVHGGQGMPAFGDSLKPEEVEDLVSFLRAKKWISPPKSQEPQPPAATPGD